MHPVVNVRSCLSSQVKKAEIRKRVSFSEDVVEPRGNGKEWRKWLKFNRRKTFTVPDTQLPPVTLFATGTIVLGISVATLIWAIASCFHLHILRGAILLPISFFMFIWAIASLIPVYDVR